MVPDVRSVVTTARMQVKSNRLWIEKWQALSYLWGTTFKVTTSFEVIHIRNQFNPTLPTKEDPFELPGNLQKLRKIYPSIFVAEINQSGPSITGIIWFHIAPNLL